MEVKRNHLYAAGLALLAAALLYGGSHRDKLLPHRSGKTPAAVVRECQRASERASYLAAFVRRTSSAPSSRALADAIVSTIPLARPDTSAADVDLVQNARTGVYEYRLTEHARAAQASGCES